MHYKTCFLFFVCCFLELLQQGLKGDAPETPIENSTAVLECGIQEQHTYRYWYTGHFNKTTPPPGGDKGKLFEQFQNNQVNRKTKRSDMSADSGSFALTIGSVMLDDDGYFTCASKYGNDDTIYKSQRIHVYIQPTDNDLQIGGAVGDLTEGDVVTASCTVNRLYPEIASVGSFDITWGDNTNSSYEKHDPVGADKAFKYTVTITKTLNSSDNGTTIQCDLQPEIGTAVHREKSVMVRYKPIGRPLLSVNESGPIPHSDVTFTCNYTGMEANPAVHSVEWKNNDTDVTHPSFVYTIKDVSAAHNGNYSCRVGNTIGFSDVSNKIVLVVSEFYAPQGSPTLSVTDLDPLPEQPVNLNCNHEGLKANPQVDHVQWIKDGENLNVTSFEYTLPEAIPEDSGNYSCRVGNALGFSDYSEQIDLSVNQSLYYPPRGLPELSITDLTPNEGEPVTFTCKTEQVESYLKLRFVNWTKSGNLIISWPDNKYSQTINFTLDDIATYRCCVANSLGCTEWSSPVLVSINQETGPSGGEKYSTAFPVVCGLLVVVLCINLVGFILFMVRRRRNEATNETGNQRASSLSRLGDNGFPTSTANIPMATSSQAPEYAEIPEDRPTRSLQSTQCFANAALDKDGYEQPTQLFARANSDILQSQNPTTHSPASYVNGAIGKDGHPIPHDYMDVMAPSEEGKAKFQSPHQPPHEDVNAAVGNEDISNDYEEVLRTGERTNGPATTSSDEHAYEKLRR